ncbi:hypothetical protein BGZ80_010625 [Entomortierella chlamydospora]|uniref:Uncharacterized protein n=1 Tax=Entomortierella chlamydospora TaxID=101097 RepID=A0A9P6N2Z6_9FUNG|nr:hypothetical protein BGZ80_010625 [Entomortierella chlamydospora]
MPHAEPFQLPELAHLGGSPHASFLDEDYDKHVSVASSFSTGILDEAVVMAMNTKATPKVMRLNAIKADNSELIQRSNSLHTSNSIRRTQSQRKAAANKVKVEVDRNRGTTGDSPDEKTPGGDHEHAQQDQQQYTPTVMVTGPSARSSTQSATSAKRKPRPSHMVLEPRPLHPSYHNQSPSTSKSLQNEVQTAVASEPSMKVTTSPSTPIAVASVLTPAPNTSQPPKSASTTRTLPAGDQDYRKHSAKILESDGRRATWSANNNKAANSNTSPPPPNTRYSTFSTQSDSRSTTTRGDGEEIMIFWDGHRDSRSSDNI